MINKTIIFLGILFIGLASCSSDPCDENMDSLECELGDFDGDGILNGVDEDPSDFCVPNLPSFEENLIGTWTYTNLGGEAGEVTFNSDGTYEEATGEIISSGAITSRMWSIEGQGVKFDVGNAGATLTYTSYDCDSINFTAFGFPLIFNRK